MRICIYQVCLLLLQNENRGNIPSEYFIIQLRKKSSDLMGQIRFASNGLICYLEDRIISLTDQWIEYFLTSQLTGLATDRVRTHYIDKLLFMELFFYSYLSSFILSSKTNFSGKKVIRDEIIFTITQSSKTFRPPLEDQLSRPNYLKTKYLCLQTRPYTIPISVVYVGLRRPTCTVVGPIPSTVQLLLTLIIHHTSPFTSFYDGLTNA